MPTSKYVQLHPTNTEDNVIDESVNIYPIIGPGSFEGFQQAGETFEPQEKLVNEVNIKSITVGNTTTNLLAGGNLNLNNVLLNLLYPVGAIYTSVTDPHSGTCPIQATLGGTWERIKDRFLWAKGDNDTLGDDTKGSKNAIVVAHTHDAFFTGNQGTTLSGGESSHSHTSNVSKIYHGDNLQNAFNSDKNHDYLIKAENDMSHENISTTSANIAAHTHTFVPSGSVSIVQYGQEGTNANMPPYLVVMAWKRVS